MTEALVMNYKPHLPKEIYSRQVEQYVLFEPKYKFKKTANTSY